MAKEMELNSAATPQPKTPMAKKYKIKSGADTLNYPGFGYPVTKAHLEGPKAETFIAAFKKLDAKSNADLPQGAPKIDNYSKFIEEA